MSIVKLPLTVAALASEPVLVAAWKKAQRYIRYHNWYADVLALDAVNADLEATIERISAEILSDQPLRSEPVQMVPAPKSQCWKIGADSQWLPADNVDPSKRLRPLAHVSPRDQIIAMAFVILFGDFVESRLGDPSVANDDSRKVASYGNRLLCGRGEGGLRFKWGSAAVYRGYFQDYRSFVARPRRVVESLSSRYGTRWAIVHADLSQFYDRVNPGLVSEKLQHILAGACEDRLMSKFTQFFQWKWSSADELLAKGYAASSDPAIADFDTVALPQGLVASGFFANAVLCDFDDAIQRYRRESLGDGMPTCIDYCRYVDDMRFVLAWENGSVAGDESKLKVAIGTIIRDELARTAPGLVINQAKLEVVLGSRNPSGERPLAAVMERAAHSVSGVMDSVLAQETLDSLEGLLPVAELKPIQFGNKFKDAFPEIGADVKGETAARFAAQRFRKIFRERRPLCEGDAGGPTSRLTKAELDAKAGYFARRLIGLWVSDPSNVRLLRVALDLRPSPDVLQVVIELLSRYLFAEKRDEGPFRVAAYCAAELLKAGATETGKVNDPQLLPGDLATAAVPLYRTHLDKFAERCKEGTMPWYLRQQSALYLLVNGDFVRWADLARVASPAVFATSETAGFLLRVHYGVWGTPDSMPAAATTRLCQEAPDLALRLLRHSGVADHKLLKKTLKRLGMYPSVGRQESYPRSRAVSVAKIARWPHNPFQQEYASLMFAIKLLETIKSQPNDRVISANDVVIECKDWDSLKPERFPFNSDAFNVSVRPLGDEEADLRFAIPSWLPPERIATYRLGQLARVLLTGRADFSRWTDGPGATARKKQRNSPSYYVPYQSAWMLRRYGMFNGRAALGPAWLPISPWFGSLLARLLEWPGFDRQAWERGLPEEPVIEDVLRSLQQREKDLAKKYGSSCRTPVLPVNVSKELARNGDGGRPDGLQDTAFYTMRLAVVQTVLPRPDGFKNDPTLKAIASRRACRNHLSSVLAGVGRMLDVRGTHSDGRKRIDLLLLPELSVHPDDIGPVLRVFARQHRCAVCAGIVFTKMGYPAKLVNHAQWILPSVSASGAIQYEHLVQGKYHRTKAEIKLGVEPFRPAQWVIDWRASPDDTTSARRFSMSAAICFDATDLSLASDLRNLTDLFVVPALNQDVGTFDNMVAALNYHMFQHVVVANSGGFGGSTAQAPFKEKHRRTIFHTHGSEHVTISFFDFDMGLYRRRGAVAGKDGVLKSPPAGLTRLG
ncbi:MAG: RNA-directed DNA polymerase [Phycisphaerae bacterium]